MRRREERGNTRGSWSRATRPPRTLLNHALHQTHIVKPYMEVKQPRLSCEYGVKGHVEVQTGTHKDQGRVPRDDRGTEKGQTNMRFCCGRVNTGRHAACARRHCPADNSGSIVLVRSARPLSEMKCSCLEGLSRFCTKHGITAALAQ